MNKAFKTFILTMMAIVWAGISLVIGVCISNVATPSFEGVSRWLMIILFAAIVWLLGVLAAVADDV